MDKKLYNTWMTVISLVLGIMGLAFMLVSIFDANAGTSVLIIGMLFVASGTLFNAVRMHQRKGNKEV